MAESFNPFEQYRLDPSTGMRNEYMQMRMMNMENRNMGNLHAPRYGGRSGLDQANPMLSSMLGGGQGQADYSQFTYNPQAREAASKYLGQYGLSPLSPAQVNPNAVLPNTGFFGRHPRVASGLEGAMFGAASTRGSDTIGEGISNVAAGLIEGPQMRKNLVNRQFAVPFQAANMFEQMEDKQALRRYRDAEIQHLEMENKRYAHDRNIFPIPAGAEGFMVEDHDAPGGYKLIPNPFPNTRNNPELDPEKRFFDSKTQEFQSSTGKMPGSKEFGAWKKEWADKSTKEPTPQRPQQELWQHADGKIFELRPGYQLQPGDKALKQAERAPADAAKRREDWVKKTLANPMATMQFTGEYPVSAEDSVKATKALQDFYDTNLSQVDEDSSTPTPGGAAVPTWDPTTRKLKK